MGEGKEEEPHLQPLGAELDTGNQRGLRHRLAWLAVAVQLRQAIHQPSVLWDLLPRYKRENREDSRGDILGVIVMSTTSWLVLF
jgi:hypothetical protein